MLFKDIKKLDNPTLCELQTFSKVSRFFIYQILCEEQTEVT